MDDIFTRCHQNAPNFGVRAECFKASLKKTIEKFLLSNLSEPPSIEEIKDFLDQIQADDLFLSLGCASGNERAWWEFDQQHRSYLERVARHLARTDVDAEEVVDTVYVELYGTRVVDGERVSKFATYSGRGSLRGWLRTVIWHSLVDLHRASHDEVSLDEMTENVGEGYAHSNFAETELGGEDQMVDHIAREKYRKATLAAIEKAFAELDSHEKLLLLYYHVEDLKLREIARLVEKPSSPLRDWFQRKSASRDKNPSSRIHESTIMRWLEKSYTKVLHLFRAELNSTHKLSQEEIEICLELATQDLASSNIYRNLTTT
ncbi:MAG: sigma-70 family RNA polymerase sigma factor [Pyrinomonadaceae bacterium]